MSKIKRCFPVAKEKLSFYLIDLKFQTCRRLCLAWVSDDLPLWRFLQKFYVSNGMTFEQLQIVGKFTFKKNDNNILLIYLIVLFIYLIDLFNSARNSDSIDYNDRFKEAKIILIANFNQDYFEIDYGTDVPELKYSPL